MAKKFSIESRAAFHKKRSTDSHVSEGKRFYSRQWLDGFNDVHAKHNITATKIEKAHMREMGLLTRDQSIFYDGYIRGCKARIDSGLYSE